MSNPQEGSLPSPRPIAEIMERYGNVPLSYTPLPEEHGRIICTGRHDDGTRIAALVAIDPSVDAVMKSGSTITPTACGWIELIVTTVEDPPPPLTGTMVAHTVSYIRDERYPQGYRYQQWEPFPIEQETVA